MQSHEDIAYGDVTIHRLELVDLRKVAPCRPRHPWEAHCCCGWKAVSCRRRCDAEKRYNAHVNTEAGTNKRRGTSRARRRVPTPRHKLPEALR